MQNDRRLVAIIGVDGSGKSSVISAVRQRLNSLGIRAEGIPSRSKRRISPEISNYEHTPRPLVFCLAKFTWRAITWIYLYIIHYAPLLRRGGIILCDRFYFDDLLLDPLKYRYAGPIQLVMRLRNFLPHPAMYILLDAPEAVLYARKQEAPFSEVVKLRQTYLDFVKGRENSFVVDASAPLEKVVEAVYQIILKRFYITA